MIFYYPTQTVRQYSEALAVIVLSLCLFVLSPGGLTAQTIGQTTVSQKDIRGIKINMNYLLINEKEKLIGNANQSVRIYYYHNLVLYHLESPFDTTIVNINNYPQVIVDWTKFRYHFLIRDKDSSYGYYYDSVKSPLGERVPIDSMLKPEWWTNINLDQKIFLSDTSFNLTLISSYTSADSDSLHEIYECRKKGDTSLIGSCFLDFTNSIRGIDYSLSKELDSIKCRKLYKVRLVSGQQSLKDSGVTTMARVELTVSLKDIPVEYGSEISDYFERYNQRYNKLSP